MIRRHQIINLNFDFINLSSTLLYSPHFSLYYSTAHRSSQSRLLFPSTQTIEINIFTLSQLTFNSFSRKREPRSCLKRFQLNFTRPRGYFRQPRGHSTVFQRPRGLNARGQSNHGTGLGTPTLRTYTLSIEARLKTVGVKVRPVSQCLSHI